MLVSLAVGQSAAAAPEVCLREAFGTFADAAAGGGVVWRGKWCWCWRSLEAGVFTLAGVRGCGDILAQVISNLFAAGRRQAVPAWAFLRACVMLCKGSMCLACLPFSRMFKPLCIRVGQLACGL